MTSELDPHPTTALLEHLTLACVDSINARDWTYSTACGQLFLSHVDIPNFTAQFDSYPQVMNWQQQNEAWQAMFSKHPEAQFNVTSISTTVDEKHGKATVMMESEVLLFGSVTVHGLSSAEWKRVGGKWLFYHTTGMKSTKSNNGFVG